jgi:hypothetical protein
MFFCWWGLGRLILLLFRGVLFSGGVFDGKTFVVVARLFKFLHGIFCVRSRFKERSITSTCVGEVISRLAAWNVPRHPKSTKILN